jgi:hypothetical protein
MQRAAVIAVIVCTSCKAEHDFTVVGVVDCNVLILDTGDRVVPYGLEPLDCERTASHLATKIGHTVTLGAGGCLLRREGRIVRYDCFEHGAPDLGADHWSSMPDAVNPDLTPFVRANGTFEAIIRQTWTHTGSIDEELLGFGLVQADRDCSRRKSGRCTHLLELERSP